MLIFALHIKERNNEMANKRTLKHAINGICEELFVECIAASLYGNEKHRQGNADALLYAIIKMQSNFIARVSHPEPGITPHRYYRDLREKFSAQVGEIADQINYL